MRKLTRTNSETLFLVGIADQGANERLRKEEEEEVDCELETCNCERARERDDRLKAQHKFLLVLRAPLTA